jgi:DnaJ like chaperone protein
MAIWGKIVGGAAGLALGGPIGAVIGAVAGHAYDLYREQDRRGRLERRRGRVERPRRRERDIEAEIAGERIFADPTETRRIAFATAVIVLSAKLAKVDGVVSRDEIRAFKQTFRIDDREVGDVARIYDHAKSSGQGFEPYARQIAALFRHDPYLLEELMVGLIEVARADGEINAAELDFLRRVAGIFGFDEGAFERIRGRYAASRRDLTNTDDAYAVLGVSRTAAGPEIKQAYRRLVREHHPDRLGAKGLPPEFTDQATRTLAAINAAYDRIAKERGLR